MKEMLFFNDRLKIVDQYNKWLESNPEALDCSMTFISYLHLCNLLDLEHCHDFLKLVEMGETHE